MDSPAQSLRLLSIQVGLPAAHGGDGISDKTWESGIFKFPVEGRVWLGALNLAGDGQSDLKNHGGPDRAVLAYSAEHYPMWREVLARPALAFGAFGENFTVSGLDEDSVYIGDVYALGDVVVQVTQPRSPCWKLARRNGIKDLTAQVEQRALGGWYQRVLQEGYVEAGQAIRLVERLPNSYPVRYTFQLMYEHVHNPADVAALAQIEALSPGWRSHFARMITKETQG